jgi:hypothetical protein
MRNERSVCDCRIDRAKSFDTIIASTPEERISGCPVEREREREREREKKRKEKKKKKKKETKRHIALFSFFFPVFFPSPPVSSLPSFDHDT